MNKFLMLSAAALVGGAGSAFADNTAKSHTIQFYTASGNSSYCDGMKFQKTRGEKVALGTHLNYDCAGGETQVSGTVGKEKFTLNENQSPSVSLMFDIYKPIKNGGTWDVWACISGTTCFIGNSGIYKKGFSGSREHLPTTARVAEMIAARRAVRTSQAR